MFLNYISEERGKKEKSYQYMLILFIFFKLKKYAILFVWVNFNK